MANPACQNDYIWNQIKFTPLRGIFFCFPQHNFLFIIWEFYTMHPDHIDHIRFSFLPAPPSHPCALSLRTERKEKHAKSNSCFPYTHWNMIKHPKASPFKDNRVLSHPSQFLQKPSIVKSYTVNLNIKTLFDGSSRLGGGGEKSLLFLILTYESLVFYTTSKVQLLYP